MDFARSLLLVVAIATATKATDGDWENVMASVMAESGMAADEYGRTMVSAMQDMELGFQQQRQGSTRFVVDDAEAAIQELAKDEPQHDLWAYAMHYEQTGEGAGLQAVKSAAEALLVDETKLLWVQGKERGARLRSYPRLAQAARKVISSASTARSASTAADAHVLLYFLYETGSDAFDHITKATSLRPMHSRQWMLRASLQNEQQDSRAALKDMQKSRDYATNDYERWSTDGTLGKCMKEIEELRGQAREKLESYVHAGYHDTVRLGLNTRDLKDVVAASFMLVELANDEGDVSVATTHYETAMRHYSTFPFGMQDQIRILKSYTDDIVTGIKSGRHAPPAASRKRRAQQPPVF